ncbi:MAG: GntR family transcriptional regulator, partial [Thermomicrobiales bacterium]|nr:GntR family transcriptional regulator [Thermomicrobiales bacterium]
ALKGRGTMLDIADEGSLADLAYSAIRRAILCCDLAPGQYVTEAQLSAQFGAGRAAVRAALARLGHERLVQAIPRKGHQIAPITFQQVRDLFGVRLIIEPAAARLAADRVDEQTMRALEECNQACQHLPGTDDITALRQANNRFHAAVAQASGNERLTFMVHTVLDELDRVLYIPQLANVWHRIDSSYDEHQRVLDGLRQRDGDAAWQAQYDHVALNQHFVIDGLISSPRLRSLNLVTI